MEQYDNRFIAFLDILGFKNLVLENSFSQNFLKIKKSLNYLSNIREEHYHGDYSVYNVIDKEISVFSDSIVISYSQSVRGGLFFILMDLVYICINLNSNGIFVRGGITFGPLYHKNHMCFGPAMVQAYELEQNDAKFPRVLISELAIENGIKICGQANTPALEKEYLSKLIKIDKDDNMPFLDYLSQIQEMDEPDCYHILLTDIKKNIVLNLNKTTGIYGIFEKYRWFAQYYNNTIMSLYTTDFISQNNLLISKELFS